VNYVAPESQEEDQGTLGMGAREQDRLTEIVGL